MVYGYFCLKIQLVEKKSDFQVKMVDLCTKIPNFKAEYLKNAQIVVKILLVLAKFVKKVYKNLNILLKDA